MVAGRIRWLRALLVAPVLVFALGASSHLAIRCTLTGVLMPESCCPDVADAALPAPIPGPSVSGPGCCERVTVATARIPAAGSQSIGPRMAQLPISHAIPLAANVVDRASTRSQSYRLATWTPGSSPPLYVVTHSFLI
jgi:hypothetical protein